MVIFVVACKSPQFAAEYVETTIIGTWTQAHDSTNRAFRFVRADTFTKFSKGFTFYEDGSLTMYLPWGCQSPPSFREMPAKWEINKKGEIVIYHSLLPGDPVYLEVLSLTNEELRYWPSKIL
jgi:hypothetical protein